MFGMVLYMPLNMKLKLTTLVFQLISIHRTKFKFWNKYYRLHFFADNIDGIILLYISYTAWNIREHNRVKSVRIRNFSGPYSVRMQDNADQKNSDYRNFWSCVRVLADPYFSRILVYFMQWQFVQNE